MRLYVASSWRNQLYPSMIEFLKLLGHEIMDWRGEKGFGWQQVTTLDKSKWTGEFYRDTILKRRRAVAGYQRDCALMNASDACVLLLPCGRSAHLEAGIFIGSGKPLYIYIPVFEEPELMYLVAKKICFTLEELGEALQ